MLDKPYVFTDVLLKLAARCNLNCTYCYWFRDDTVLSKPPLLTREAEKAFLQKLRTHVTKYQLESFTVVFHGGEPLMFGKQRFIDLCYELRQLEKELRFNLGLGITTNGVLVDDDWATILEYYKVDVTVSLDVTPESHDKFRIDKKKQGSYQRSLRAFQKLSDYGIAPHALAVCDPDANADEVFRHFIEGLGVNFFDILIPDTDHESEIPQISQFYRDLFDRWYDTYSHQGVKVRLIENIIQGLLGQAGTMESMGFTQLVTHTLHTDGSLEAVDILRIAGSGHNESNINILTHELNDVVNNDLWREANRASNELADVCKVCRYKVVCGGGHVAHRWSKENRYNNPSAYCRQLYEILSHVEERIFKDMSYRSIETTGVSYEV
ncbi:MAG: radical SAM protein [Proteobacteria bacterium]|nr:MAG: radical SAM protein [Pseudomonadota bacterium]